MCFRSLWSLNDITINTVYHQTGKGTRWCSTDIRKLDKKRQKKPLLSTYYTTQALNHGDRNITAAYLCVRPRHRALYTPPSHTHTHLHFVAHAKRCHPKSPTNLPPYGGGPVKAAEVARQRPAAPSALSGHEVVERGVLSASSILSPPTHCI